MRLLLMPLDERPVNTTLPESIARLFGVELVLPPASLLPAFRDPGKVQGLGQWLKLHAPSADAALISIDMLVYGGLIASRTSDDDLSTVLERLQVLQDPALQRPSVDLHTVSVIMRNPAGGSVEEPAYWDRFGDDLHQFGDELHRFFGCPDVAPVPPALVRNSAVRQDWARRRLRNHQVNLEMLNLLSRGDVDFLQVTSDDTAEVAIGTCERNWLEHWAAALGLSGELGRVGLQPGADELGCVLVSRAVISRLEGPGPTLSIHSAQPEGMARVAPFENRPTEEAIRDHSRAAGARAVTSAKPGSRHLDLVVHAPAPDHEGRYDYHDVRREEAVATADLVELLLADGRHVALADIRHPNGADGPLAEEITRRGLHRKLTAFGAWNTAANTLGSVIATGLAVVVNPWASQSEVLRVLTHRLLEDHTYQAVLRQQFWDELSDGERRSPLGDRAEGFCRRVEQEFESALADLGLDQQFRVKDVRFPWDRLFEIDFALHDTTTAAGSD